MSVGPAYNVFEGQDLIPGTSGSLESVSNQFWYGFPEQQHWLPALVSGTARDAGNTVTTVLRGGLLLGMVTSTKKLVQWNPAATDGSQYVYGILGDDMGVQVNGSNRDKWTRVYYGGLVRSANVIIPAEAAEGLVGKDLEWLAAIQLANRVVFDQHPLIPNKRITLTADATLTAADHGAIVDNTGAAGQIAVTLPAPLPGLEYTFLAAIDQDILVNPAGTGNVIGSAVNNDSAEIDTLAGAMTFTGISTSKYFVRNTKTTIVYA